MTMAAVKKKKRPSIFMEIRKKPLLYLLLFPAILYTFIYGYCTLPFLAIAFEKYKVSTLLFSPFVGLSNFSFFFRSSWASIVTENTIIMNLLFIVFGILLSVTLAILINELTPTRFVKTLQSSMLLPYFISWVIVSYILFGLLNTQTGLLNILLQHLGFKSVGFYNDPKYWYTIFTILTLWKGAGYTSIIYLASITGIDQELYEAAIIDGANRWQKIIRITIPLLIPMISILTLMNAGRLFSSDWNMYYSIVHDNGAILSKAEVIDTYVFRTFKVTGNPGLSMAINLYQSVVGFVLVFTSNMAVKKFYPEGSLF